MMAATDMLCGQEEEEEEEEEEEGRFSAELVAKDNHMSLYPSSTLTPRLLSPASIREETVAWRRVSAIWNLISAVVWKRKKKEPRLYSYGRARSVNHNLQTHHPLLLPTQTPKSETQTDSPLSLFLSVSLSLSLSLWTLGCSLLSDPDLCLCIRLGPVANSADNTPLSASLRQFISTARRRTEEGLSGV